MSLLPTPTYARTYISRSCVCFCDASHTGASCELDASTPTCPLYSPSNPGGLLPGLEHYTSLSEQGQLWFNLEAGRKLCEAEVSFAHGAGELFSSPCLLSSPKVYCSLLRVYYPVLVNWSRPCVFRPAPVNCSLCRVYLPVPKVNCSLLLVFCRLLKINWPRPRAFRPVLVNCPTRIRSHVCSFRL